MKSFFLFLLFTSSSYACLDHGPEFNYEAPVYPAQGLTYEEANEVIESVASVYTPIFKSKGFQLGINNFWDSTKMISNSWIVEDQASIAIHGAYSRHPKMTQDALLGIVCHEVGHFLGGEPRFGEPTPWASGEGQSDFFSSYECVRKVMKKFKRPVKVAGLSPEVIQNCEAVFKTESDRQICKRTAQSAIDYGAFRGLSRITLSTIPVNVVTETILDYPTLECRIQTKYLGALCTGASCERPRCWSSGN